MGLEQNRALPKPEKRLIAILSAQLIFLPWALGDRDVWSQILSLALAVAGVVLALGRQPDRRSKLCRFPIFWLGAALSLYIAIQGLNPAWGYAESAGSWWITPIRHIAWLPHGMKTPFAIDSPWRVLLIFSSAWLTTCAIWIGFTRRHSLRALLTVLAANACALAIFGVLEQAFGADRIFWSWKPPDIYFVSTFVYRNHAGAYFALLLALSVGLGVYHLSRRHHRGWTPATLVPFAAIAVALSFIIVLSNSRAAFILMVLFYLTAPALLYSSGFLFADSRRKRSVLSFLYLGIGVLFIAALAWLRKEPVLTRLDQLAQGNQSSQISFRMTAARATIDMFRQQPVYGWGAGGFRFGFPYFQRHYPLIWISEDGRRLYWEHAHNDWAECLAELGIVGSAILAAALAWSATFLIRRRFWTNPCVLLLIFGCTLTLLHAAADFPFHNPAILVTWWAILAIALRWLEIDIHLARDSDEEAANTSNRTEIASPARLG